MSLPIRQNILGARNRKPHELGAHAFHIRFFLTEKRQKISARAAAIRFPHERDHRHERRVHHIPIGIDAVIFEPFEERFLAVHARANRRNLAVRHFGRVKILRLRRKTHVILAEQNFPHRETGHIVIALLAEKHAVHIKNDLLHKSPLHRKFTHEPRQIFRRQKRTRIPYLSVFFL